MVIPSTGCCSFPCQEVIEGGVHYDLFDDKVKLRVYLAMLYFLACLVMGAQKKLYFLSAMNLTYFVLNQNCK